MDQAISYNDDEHIESHLSKTQSLEAAYQEALRNTDMIVKDEGARRLRLRILMLENENDDLHEQLALSDDRVDVLEAQGDELREQLERVEDDAQRHEADARVQARELSNVRAELTSMNGLTMDSTKLLTEKLSLAREIATIKPELEHLRSQATYHQTILSEKLALQRQVSTLEVELETEKRASKRAADKNDSREREAELQGQVEALQKDLARQKREGGKAVKEREAELQTEVESLQKDLARQKREGGKASKERDAELQNQLEALEKELAREKKEGGKASKERESELQDQLDTLQKDLAREKREGVKAQKEAEKELKAAESRYTVLESKLDQIRTKLRATKEELKECQSELSQARSANTKMASTDPTARNPRKRAAVDMSTDGAIGTPDGVAVRGKRPAVKRGRADQTMVGEKSMFSITPFLNKTVNMALDTPAKDEELDVVEEEDEEEDVEKQAPQQAQNEVVPDLPVITENSSPMVASKARGKKKAADRPKAVEKKPLEEAKTNTQNKKPAPEKRAISTLEQVAEEDADENEQPSSPAPTKGQSKPSAVAKVAVRKPAKLQTKATEAEAGPTKKKRKLLGGKTLFDEEDGEATKRPTKVSLGAPRLLGKGGLAGPKGGLKGGLGAGFGSFSPLKKDRRGVGASFLA
ncbi:hypothetical protein LSUE1_G001212 [Lachnellula suecica]|uniref:Uncharacterized protein n=1 Tax=Lachnellula suecica TaxID=602035 RepID=A0A8T9CFB1_9HELO|nr:hypothetical protein LSUE1_G001212 [Lachnellula suecica]